MREPRRLVYGRGGAVTEEDLGPFAERGGALVGVERAEHCRLSALDRAPQGRAQVGLRAESGPFRQGPVGRDRLELGSGVLHGGPVFALFSP